MIVEKVKDRNGREVGEIRKPDNSLRWRWSAYVKGTLSFRIHYAFIGTFGGKPDAKKAVKQWRHQ